MRSHGLDLFNSAASIRVEIREDDGTVHVLELERHPDVPLTAEIMSNLDRRRSLEAETYNADVKLSGRIASARSSAPA